MIWSTAANLVRSLLIPVMDKLAGKITWKKVLALSQMLMASCGILWLSMTKENMWFMFPIATIVSSMPYAGLGVAMLKMQVATMPEKMRSVYFSVSALTNGASSLAGSLLCSFMVKILEGYSLGLLGIIFIVGMIGVTSSGILTLKLPVKDV